MNKTQTNQTFSTELQNRQDQENANQQNYCNTVKNNPNASTLEQMYCKDDIQSLVKMQMERRKQIRDFVAGFYDTHFAKVYQLVQLQKAKKSKEAQYKLQQQDRLLNELSGVNTTIDVIVRRILDADPKELDNLHAQFQIANHKKTQLNADEFMEQLLKTNDKPLFTENIVFKKNQQGKIIAENGDTVADNNKTETETLFSIENIFRRLGENNDPLLAQQTNNPVVISNGFAQPPLADTPNTPAFRRRERNSRLQGRLIHDTFIKTPQKSMLKQFAIIEDLFQNILQEEPQKIMAEPTDEKTIDEKQILHEHFTIRQTNNWISQYTNDPHYFFYKPFCFTQQSPQSTQQQSQSPQSTQQQSQSQQSTLPPPLQQPPQQPAVLSPADIDILVYCYYCFFSRAFGIPMKTAEEFNAPMNEAEKREFSAVIAPKKTRKENIGLMAQALNIRVVFFDENKYNQYKENEKEKEKQTTTTTTQPAVSTEISLKQFIEPPVDKQQDVYYIMVNVREDNDVELVEYKEKGYFTELPQDVLN